MKEFNLEEYLKNPSQKVVTRDGRAVRIICTDIPIVALIYDEKKQKESIECFFENGKYLSFDANDSPLDLFFAPVKKEGWVNINFSVDKGKYVGEEIYSSEDEAIENSKFGIYIATVKIEWEE